MFKLRFKEIFKWTHKQIIFVVLFVIVFMLYLRINGPPGDYRVCTELDERFRDWVRPFNKAEKNIFARLTIGSNAVVRSRFCLRTDDTCYFVVDVFNSNSSRQLYFLNYKASLSGAKITVEEGEVQLLHDYLPYPYTRALVGAPFAYGSVRANDSGTFLLIGMGMGAMNSFLAQLDNQKHSVTVVESNPAMLSIARRWFNLNDNLNNHHVVLDDGVDYIKRAVIRRRKFDAILIDACISNLAGGAALGCPVEPFRKPKIIREIRNILTDRGVVAFNIASLSDYPNYRNDSAAFRKMCARIFTWCTYLDFRGSDGFICGKSDWTPPPNGRQRWDYQRRVGALPERLQKLFAVKISRQSYEPTEVEQRPDHTISAEAEYS